MARGEGRASCKPTAGLAQAALEGWLALHRLPPACSPAHGGSSWPRRLAFSAEPRPLSLTSAQLQNLSALLLQPPGSLPALKPTAKGVGSRVCSPSSSGSGKEARAIRWAFPETHCSGMEMRHVSPMTVSCLPN